jgi:hypothetical protein
MSNNSCIEKKRFLKTKDAPSACDGGAEVQTGAAVKSPTNMRVCWYRTLFAKKMRTILEELMKEMKTINNYAAAVAVSASEMVVNMVGRLGIPAEFTSYLHGSLQTSSSTHQQCFGYDRHSEPSRRLSARPKPYLDLFTAVSSRFAPTSNASAAARNTNALAARPRAALGACSSGGQRVQPSIAMWESSVWGQGVFTYTTLKKYLYLDGDGLT